MPPQRRKSSIGGGSTLPRNPLADEAEHTPPVSPLRDAEWQPTAAAQPAAARPAPAEPTAARPAAAQPADSTRLLRTDGLIAKRLAEQPTKPTAPIALPIRTPHTADPAVPPSSKPAAEPVMATAKPAPAQRDTNEDILSIPLPTPGDGPLSSREQEQLELCESSIDALRVAFWTAGRALQIVRDGRLYRSEHGTFDDYVEKRWDMQRSYAHKLIRAWPLAARLHPMAPSINEGQVRELLPIVVAHGEDVAVTVYTTLAADGKVTASRLREAVAVLPSGADRGEVMHRLHAWLRGDLPEDPSRALGSDVFSTAESRLTALARKVVKGSGTDPAAAREFAAKMRTLAELIEQQLPATPVR
ncbi:hypothetical protein [Nocardia jejuensis]|uniref:hypothetical protein n=1 Tax=Nocardia jejuensis TaxID=328049 RepID=UPI00083475B0|nr:hypothetical protein [Nocardia jejuensis]